jgi:Ca2+-binding EF-hand superfamily protein
VFSRSRDRHRRKDAAGEPELIRPYEHWHPAAQHDLDGSGQLNWPEFEKHRAAVKKQLLGQFDKDRNGRLLGPEREEANDWLRRSIHVRGRQRRPWRIARWDDNDDGKLDPHEQRRREAWLARQQQAKQRQDELNVWDTNKDGTIDLQERAVMAAELKRREAQRQARIRRWDRDGDGKLNEKETYVMERCEPGDPRRKRDLLKHFDRNRDGKLDQKERTTVEQHFAREYDREQHQRMLRRYDKNRDGKLDEKERALMAADRRKQAAQDDRK